MQKIVSLRERLKGCRLVHRETCLYLTCTKSLTRKLNGKSEIELIIHTSSYETLVLLVQTLLSFQIFYKINFKKNAIFLFIDIQDIDI